MKSKINEAFDHFEKQIIYLSGELEKINIDPKTQFEARLRTFFESDAYKRICEAPSTDATTREATLTTMNEATMNEATTNEATTADSPTTEVTTAEAPKAKAPIHKAIVNQATTADFPTTEVTTPEAPIQKAPTSEAEKAKAPVQKAKDQVQKATSSKAQKAKAPIIQPKRKIINLPGVLKSPFVRSAVTKKLCDVLPIEQKLADFVFAAGPEEEYLFKGKSVEITRGELASMAEFQKIFNVVLDAFSLVLNLHFQQQPKHDIRRIFFSANAYVSTSLFYVFCS